MPSSIVKKLVLLDRDGVVIVNRPTNVKQAEDVTLIEGAAEGISRLNQAGYTVAICTNQPEVSRGVMSIEQLKDVHSSLLETLKSKSAHVDRVFSCTTSSKSPRNKPACGMLHEALAFYNAEAAATPFVGDQADDLKAAFHARCRRVLVKTGLGAKTLLSALPDYLRPFSVHEDLLAAALSIIQHGL